jgi:hypothetical protein
MRPIGPKGASLAREVVFPAVKLRAMAAWMADNAPGPQKLYLLEPGLFHTHHY